MQTEDCITNFPALFDQTPLRIWKRDWGAGGRLRPAFQVCVLFLKSGLVFLLSFLPWGKTQQAGAGASSQAVEQKQTWASAAEHQRICLGLMWGSRDVEILEMEADRLF